jgi:Pyruvate dehydrogenase complex, dehydrogenase (E1) component
MLADDAAFFQGPDAAEAGGRAQAHGGRELGIGDSGVLLEGGQDPEVDCVQIESAQFFDFGRPFHAILQCRRREQRHLRNQPSACQGYNRAMTSAAITALPRPVGEADPIASLEALERRALWLSTWMIHNANHLRPNRDGLKVGGHQASCASSVTLLAALYGHAVRPEDRVAVKPHAGPVFHALMYLMGAQSREALERFRGFGGVQSYPSRTKDTAPVDFSTGSVGLGVGVTLFASLVQDYLQTHGCSAAPPGG